MDGGRSPRDVRDWQVPLNEVWPLTKVSTGEVRQIVARQELVEHRQTPAKGETPMFPADTVGCLVIDPNGRWTRASAPPARRSAIICSTR